MGKQATRNRILNAALKQFAHSGYVGTSVQDIVDAARVTKPTLYYYFKSKAGLYQALIDWAHDERFRLMNEAAASSKGLEQTLVRILDSIFDFLFYRRDLMRLAFAAYFAAPGEIPSEIDYLDKAWRNYDFISNLIQEGINSGLLSRAHDSAELTMSFFGMMTIYVMRYLIEPKASNLKKGTAKKIVSIFMEGAAASRNGPSRRKGLLMVGKG